MINIVLYAPEIPHNTGSIGRSCVVTNSRLHLIKPYGFILNDKNIKRAGMDYWDKLDVVEYNSLEEFMDMHQNCKIFFSTKKTDNIYTDAKFEDNCYIMFGRESNGLPQWIHDNYPSTCIRIPMRDIEYARSLNLSNSVSIMLYEALRQIGFGNLI